MDNNSSSIRLSYLLASPQNIIKSLISSFPDDISLSDLHDSSTSSGGESDHHNGNDRGIIRSDRGVISVLQSEDGTSDDDEALSLARKHHHHLLHSDGDSTPTLSLPNSFEGDDALDFKDVQRKFYSHTINQQRQQQQSRCAK